MALTSLVSFNLSNTFLIIALLHLLLPTLYCFSHYPPPDTTQGVLVAEKTRLGSTPPSCYNKCNKCHPCMAVQVPTLPSNGRLEPTAVAVAVAGSAKPKNYFESSSEEGNRYSNYKPLGWKCRCDGHFYNP